MDYCMGLLKVNGPQPTPIIYVGEVQESSHQSPDGSFRFALTVEHGACSRFVGEGSYLYGIRVTN